MRFGNNVRTAFLFVDRYVKKQKNFTIERLSLYHAAVSILIILIYGKIDEKATIKAYPGFRVDLEMLNSAFRGSGKSFQMYSQTGSTFQIESLADSPNAFPLQFVMEGENSVFSTQPSVFVESVAGRDYATHAFVREVAMLNEIRRQRKMTSTWWIWLQMFVFIGAVAVGAALAIFFSQSNAIAIVFSVLGGFVSGYGLCMLIGHFVRVEVERFLDSTASVMEELQHRHMDENAWEWYFEDTRTSPKFKLFRMIEKFSPISLHVTAEFAFMGIRKKLSDDASSSHLDIV